MRHAIKAALLTLTLVAAGCGGGGGSSAPATANGVASVTAPLVTEKTVNSFAVTSDSYGMTQPNYLSASNTPQGVVLRSALATSMTDPDFKTVCRVDIPAGFVPVPGNYSLGSATAGTPAFPGAVYFFNGHQSTLLGTVGGTISFTSFGTSSGNRISGSFSAVVEDGGDSATPKSRYTIAASFDLGADSAGPTATAPVSAALAAPLYDSQCASCHALGSHDTTRAGAPDLALRGGKLASVFVPDQASHLGLTLTPDQINSLKVLLNSN